MLEEFEDTKEVIKRRTDNTKGQKKKYKRANNDLQNIHIINKGNNKITELRTILQRESQNS